MKIPAVSISRILLYYRAILSLGDADIVSSQDIADLTGYKAAQVRKDLAYFGQFGRPGSGYNVGVLKNQLKKILGVDRTWDVALVGVGNLGSALLAYKGFKKQGFNIRYAFDNDPKKIGKIRQGLRIYNFEKIDDILGPDSVEMAIIAVPQDVAQEVLDKVVGIGIKAILNFAPVRLKVPEDAVVLNIDLSMELEKLTYFLLQKRKA